MPCVPESVSWQVALRVIAKHENGAEATVETLENERCPGKIHQRAEHAQDQGHVAAAGHRGAAQALNFPS